VECRLRQGATKRLSYLNEAHGSPCGTGYRVCPTARLVTVNMVEHIERTGLNLCASEISSYILISAAATGWVKK
jgi:hypothetical protein